MSSELKDLAKQIVDIANGDVKKKTRAYDTTATVTRVDGDTTYVHIPGGVQETPVKTTVGAKKGDIVQVRVANKSAWMVGNASAPPTDDKVANMAKSIATTAESTAETAEQTAKEAGATASQAKQTAKEAGTTASQAKQIADNTKQHFWFNETGEDTGAHITEVTQDEWNDTESPNYHQGGNFLARSNGLAIRDGLSELASFGADGAVVGRDSRMEITGAGIEAFDVDGMSIMNISQTQIGQTGTVTKVKYNHISDTPFNQSVVVEDNLSSFIPANVSTIKLSKDSLDYTKNTIAFRSQFTPCITTDAPTNISGMSKKTGSGGRNKEAKFTLNTMTITRGVAQTVTAYAIVPLNDGETMQINIERKYIPSTDTLKMTISTTTQSSGDFNMIRISKNFAYSQTVYPPDFRFGTRRDGDLGGFTFSSGSELLARYEGKTVFGKYNADYSDSVFEIGNGSSGHLGNALTVYWNGDTYMDGYLSARTRQIPISTFESGWKVYGDNTDNTPTLRVFGHVINLKGVLTNTASKTLNNTAQAIFSIPLKYAPSDCVASGVFNGSDSNRYNVTVETNGTVKFGRYTNGTSYSAQTAGKWFPFNLTWIID